MVSKFISSLLGSNKKTQEWFFAQQLPKGLFKEGASQINWIFSYRDTKGRYPTRAEFDFRFPKYAVEPHGRDTLEVCVQPILDQSVFNEMSAAIASAKTLYTSGEPVGKVLGHLRAALSGVKDYTEGSIDLKFSDSPLSDIRYRERVAAHSRGDSSFLPSPWEPLNDLLGYSEAGEHTVVSSRTSIGKTWLLLWWAKHFVDAGERVLIVSKEMPTHQIADRFEALQFHLDWPMFRKGTLRPKDLWRWRQERRRYPVSKNLIVTGQETVQGVGFGHIISKIQQYGPTVMFVDGAYLIYPENIPKNASDVQRFTVISNTMKRLSMAYKLKAFSAVQVNREGESKDGDTKPTLKNVYGADAWAQDCDNLIMISGRRGSSSRFLDLAKGRESALGGFHVNFKLQPYPSFDVRGGGSTKLSGDENAVEFKAAEI